MSLHCAITPATIICNSINILGAWDLPEFVPPNYHVFPSSSHSRAISSLELFPGWSPSPYRRRPRIAWIYNIFFFSLSFPFCHVLISAAAQFANSHLLECSRQCEKRYEYNCLIRSPRFNSIRAHFVSG